MKGVPRGGGGGGGEPTCKGTARAVGILAAYVGRLVNGRLPSVVEDVHDRGPVGLFFRDATVPGQGQMPAFDQDVAGPETPNRLGNVDEIVEGTDFGRFDAGVLEQQSGFGDVWGQDGGQR